MQSKIWYFYLSKATFGIEIKIKRINKLTRWHVVLFSKFSDASPLFSYFHYETLLWLQIKIMHLLINTCECDMYMKPFMKNWFPYVNNTFFSFHVVLNLILEKYKQDINNLEHKLLDRNTSFNWPSILIKDEKVFTKREIKHLLLQRH